jgi:diguanylate cyclase (GGDEF)-like protein
MGMRGASAVRGVEGAQRLAHQFTRATLLLLAAVVAIVIGGLFWATHRSDEISIQRQERVAIHSIDVALDELALQQETVAIWDDMATYMIAARPNQTWLFDNGGSWLHRIFDHHESWLIDERNQPVQIVVAGKRIAATNFQRHYQDIQPLVAAARGVELKTNGRHDRHPGEPLGARSTVRTTDRASHATRLILIGGRPAVASAMLIQPSTPGYVGDRLAWPALVSIRYLDASFMIDLDHRFLIDNARFSRRNDHSDDEYSSLIRTEGGEDLGYLIWTPELPGTRVIGALFPVNLVALVLLALLMAFLLRKLTQSLRDGGTLEERATYLAYHDPLTRLPNRSLLAERLQEWLATGLSQEIALLLIDLDQFKQVNDTLGHLAGDELIRQFADRLRDEIGQDDMVARLGGDEFAVLLRGAAAAEALDRSQRILKLFGQPFDLAGTSIYGGASIGAAQMGSELIDGTELMRRADVALYRAKAEGRGRARLFEDQMDDASRQRVRTEHELREAIAADQLALWHQPEVDRHGVVIGQELLLRWEHPDLGIVNPDQILPVAEESGLIIPIGDWVIRQALPIAAAVAVRNEFTALNLSPSQLRDENFAERTILACTAAGVAPSVIELEITEQTLIEDNPVIRDSLSQLRQAGFRISLDDFGTGYSSLSYLSRFTVDKIKIDRSFVAEIEHSAEARAIIAAIVTLGRALGLSIAAEGVETARQEQLLLLAGCDQLQGHYYAPARPLPDLLRSAA